METYFGSTPGVIPTVKVTRSLSLIERNLGEGFLLSVFHPLPASHLTFTRTHTITHKYTHSHAWQSKEKGKGKTKRRR